MNDGNCNMFKFVIEALLLLIMFYSGATAQAENPLTLIALDNPAPGYILMDSRKAGYLTIVDNSCMTAYELKLSANVTARSMNKQSNGLFSFFANNKFYIINKNLSIVDSFECKNGLETDFHDFKLTSEGHAYLLGVQYDTVDMSAIVTGGKPDAILRSFVIQEQDANKNVVWEWRALDHFSVTDATREVDLTQQQIAWIHTNWMDIDTDGNLIISNRNMDEITKINRQTGNIIWRLGGKECKNNQFSFLNDTVNGFYGFSHQHCVQELPNGNLLMFDNGNLKSQQFSRAVEYQIDEVNKTIRKVWEYHNFPEVYTMSQGSVQRLPNGNTIIGWGTNTQQMTLIEVRSDGSRAMEARDFESYAAMRFPIKMASKLIQIQSSGTYNFSDNADTTAVQLNIQSVNGSGFVSVERHYYLPHNLSFTGSVPDGIYGNRWVLNNKGISAFSGKIIFKIQEIDNLNSPEKFKIYWRKQEGSGTFTILETTFNQSAGTLEAGISSFGEFILGVPPVYEVPELISPANNSKKNPLTNVLLWKKVSGADSYKIQLSTINNFSTFVIDTVVTGDTVLTLQLLENNTKYFWRVKSLYGTNESNWSAVWNFTTLLSKTVLISPNNNETDFPVKNGIFKWNFVNGAIYYILNISKTAEFDSIVVDETAIADTTYNLALLDYGREYYWRIKALNSDNESLWSDTNKFTTANKVILDAPVLLSPHKDTANVDVKGSLVWEPVENALVYEADISKNQNFNNIVQSGTNVDTNIFEYNLPEYKTDYYWRVRAMNQTDTSAWSETWKFTTMEFVDVEENARETITAKYIGDRKILVYAGDNPEEARFMLFDIDGKKITGKKLKNNPETVDCSKAEPGVYFYFININGKSIKGKLLIY